MTFEAEAAITAHRAMSDPGTRDTASGDTSMPAACASDDTSMVKGTASTPARNQDPPAADVMEVDAAPTEKLPTATVDLPGTCPPEVDTIGHALDRGGACAMQLDGTGDARLEDENCGRPLDSVKRRRIGSDGRVALTDANASRRREQSPDEWFYEAVGPLRKAKRASTAVEYFQIRIPASSLPPSPEHLEMFEMDDSSVENSVDEDYSRWVHQFCDRQPQLAKVPTTFFTDNFNMQGLDVVFRRKYRTCIAIISDKFVDNSDVSQEDVHMLYLLVHQRYVQTIDGMYAVKSKMREGDFGDCMRVLCKKNPLIPVQMSDVSQAIVGFCTVCRQCVVHRKLTSELPYLGVAYGDSFPELLLMNFPKLRYPGEPEKFVPRVYGYRLAKKPDSVA